MNRSGATGTAEATYSGHFDEWMGGWEGERGEFVVLCWGFRRRGFNRQGLDGGSHVVSCSRVPSLVITHPILSDSTKVCMYTIRSTAGVYYYKDNGKLSICFW